MSRGVGVQVGSSNSSANSAVVVGSNDIPQENDGGVCFRLCPGVGNTSASLSFSHSSSFGTSAGSFLVFVMAIFVLMSSG